MGTAYRIQCKHCGTQFIHSAESGYGVQPRCIGCGDQSNNMEIIRCPGCQHILSSSIEEFSKQIIEETSWE
ncbi:MAG: hypothetical protein R3Y66_00795 [Rikenellaceae bacterium]